MNRLTSRIVCKWPAAPGNAATIIMLCTHPKKVGSLSAIAAGAVRVLQDYDGRDQPITADQISAVEIVWLENDQASNANGIHLYAMKKDTATWREVDCKDDNGVAQIGVGAPQAVPVLATPAERRILIDVARYSGFAVEYTAGATGPTSWDGTITLHLNDAVVVR